jgi:hypothetical protein
MNTTGTTGKNKAVQFDSSVDWEEEDRRTARGGQLRREKKERKQMEHRNRQERINAVVEILHDERYSTSLVALANENDEVRDTLVLIVNRFNVLQESNDISLRLEAFRNLEMSTITERLDGAVVLAGNLILLAQVTPFYEAFHRLLPATIVSSSSSEDDRSPARRDRRRGWKQTGENVAKRQRRQNPEN